MRAYSHPREAYRRIEFDARVAGADGRELVLLCFEQLDHALGQALHGAARQDNQARSTALTRALSALTALELGIDRSDPLAPALASFYAAARRGLLDNVVTFDAARMIDLRRDLGEVGEALRGALPVAG